MSQLKSLYSISRIQSDRQFLVLQKKRNFITYLNQQLSELKVYSRSYQQSAVGNDEYHSGLLVHRQQFISRLSTQIDELVNRIENLNDDAAECADKWHYLEARQKAIASMYERKCAQDTYSKETADQKNIDELSRLSFANRSDGDQNIGLSYV